MKSKFYGLENGMINKIFSECGDEELNLIYENILESTKDGIRSELLVPFAKKIKEKCEMETLSQAIDFTRQLYFEEVARRYFNK